VLRWTSLRVLGFAMRFAHRTLRPELLRYSWPASLRRIRVDDTRCAVQEVLQSWLRGGERAAPSNGTLLA